MPFTLRLATPLVLLVSFIISSVASTAPCVSFSGSGELDVNVSYASDGSECVAWSLVSSVYSSPFARCESVNVWPSSDRGYNIAAKEGTVGCYTRSLTDAHVLNFRECTVCSHDTDMTLIIRMAIMGAGIIFFSIVLYVVVQWSVKVGIYATVPKKTLDGEAITPNSEERASLVSHLFFNWISDFMKRGYDAATTSGLRTEDFDDVSYVDSAARISERFTRALSHCISTHAAASDDFIAEYNASTGKRVRTLTEIPATVRRPLSLRIPITLRALGHAHGASVFVSGVTRLVYDLLSFAQPVCLKLLLHYLEEGGFGDGTDGKYGLRLAYGLVIVFGLTVLQTIQSVSQASYFFGQLRAGCHNRIALGSAVYRKVLTVSNGSRQRPEFNTGKLTSLISSDAERLYNIMFTLHLIWSAPLSIFLALLMLLSTVGPVAILGFLMLVASIPLQAALTRLQFRYRNDVVELTDERVKGVAELLAGLKVVKLMVWDEMFGRRIGDVRHKEMLLVAEMQWIRVLSLGITVSTPPVVCFVMFALYALLGGTVSAAVVFPTMSLMVIMRFPLAMLPQLLASLTDAIVSLVRIDTFLVQPDIASKALATTEADNAAGLAIVVDNGNFSWHAAVVEKDSSSSPGGSPTSTGGRGGGFGGRGGGRGGRGGGGRGGGRGQRNESTPHVELHLKHVLRNVAFRAPRGSLTMVIGPTGSGKSSFLSGLLGECEATDTTSIRFADLAPATEQCAAKVPSSRIPVAYVPQEPWIMNATVRDNVSFFLPFDQARYDAAIEAACMRDDLKQLVAGDMTEIGEKGVNLSGGQKQRVSVARAVYANKPVVLMDDPFAAVDVHVGRSIMNDCVLGALRNSTRIIVTHQLQFIDSADQLVVVEDGEFVFQGTPVDFRASPYAAKYVLTQQRQGDEHGDTVPGDDSCKVGHDAVQKDPAPRPADANPARGARGDGAGPAGGGGQLIKEEQRAKGAVGLDVWKGFAEAAGGLNFSIVVVVIFFASSWAAALPDVFLSWWAAGRFRRIIHSDSQLAPTVTETVVPATATVPRATAARGAHVSDAVFADAPESFFAANGAAAHATVAGLDHTQSAATAWAVRGAPDAAAALSTARYSSLVQAFSGAAGAGGGAFVVDSWVADPYNHRGMVAPLPLSGARGGPSVRISGHAVAAIEAAAAARHRGAVAAADAADASPTAVGAEAPTLTLTTDGFAYVPHGDATALPPGAETDAVVGVESDAAAPAAVGVPVAGAAPAPYGALTFSIPPVVPPPSSTVFAPPPVVSTAAGVLAPIVSSFLDATTGSGTLPSTAIIDSTVNHPLLGLGGADSDVPRAIPLPPTSSAVYTAEQIKALAGGNDETLGDPPLPLILSLYGFLVVILVALSCFRGLLLFKGIRQAGEDLHSRMLMSIIKSPMGFFDVTPQGRILNRFTRDIDTVDSNIPQTLNLTLVNVATMLTNILVMVYSNVFVIIPLVPLAWFYTRIVSFYSATVRDCKRHESTSRSPIFAQFSETANGVGTLRAYGLETTSQYGNLRLLDASMRITGMHMGCQRWLGVRLELLGNSLTLLTGVSSILLVSFGFVDAAVSGLGLTYATALTTYLGMLVRQAAECESQMACVERIIEYTQLPAEPDAGNANPPPSWPASGSVEFDKVSARYREGLPLVLQSVSWAAGSGQSVGIVGRTGSGKSTILNILFRLMPIEDRHGEMGRVLIDGIDAASIPLRRLRSVLSIIPQDPFLFNGTIRSNLDPFDQHPDAELWKVLQLVGIDARVRSDASGIDALVSNGGANFAVGERQLLCLARAMLKRCKILLMDEATASVDKATDSRIQMVVRSYFEGVTVLTIAHRLQTVIDYDRILVLSAGKVIEFDSPAALLEQPGGAFRKMVEDLGPKESRAMFAAAKAGKGAAIALFGDSSPNESPNTASPVWQSH